MLILNSFSIIFFYKKTNEKLVRLTLRSSFWCLVYLAACTIASAVLLPGPPHLVYQLRLSNVPRPELCRFSLNFDSLVWADQRLKLYYKLAY